MYNADRIDRFQPPRGPLPNESGMRNPIRDGILSVNRSIDILGKNP